MKKQITPYLFENSLIIALDAQWIKAFNEIPVFEVSIGKDQKLRIISEKPLKNMDFRHS